MRVLVEQNDLRTEPLKSLSQLTADRTAADHRQAAWTLGEVKNRFVGEIAGFRQPLNRRLHGTRAGGDDRAFEAQRFARHRDLIASGKTGHAKEYVHAQLGKAPGRIVMADACPELAH